MCRHTRILLTLFLVLLAGLPLSAQAAKRVALLIGNASYASEKPLANPVRDARLLGKVLKHDLGFEVEVVENADRAQLIELLDQFQRKAAKADAAVFYFSGHGMQDGGKRNYLIPVDARIQGEAGIRAYGVQADEVVAALAQAAPRVSIVILDACRDNPYTTATRSGSKGLARMELSGDQELLIAYATRDGEVAQDGSGGNSPYAQALAKRLKQAGREPVLSLFDGVADDVKSTTSNKQRPTRYGDLKASTFLLDKPAMQVATLEPVAIGPEAPAGGVSLEDLKKQQAAREKWDAWQARMQADYEQIANLNAAPDLKVTAWERFLATYAEKNPYSEADGRLREQAKINRKAAEAKRSRQEFSASTPEHRLPISRNLIVQAMNSSPVPLLWNGEPLPSSWQASTRSFSPEMLMETFANHLRVPLRDKFSEITSTLLGNRISNDGGAAYLGFSSNKLDVVCSGLFFPECYTEITFKLHANKSQLSELTWEREYTAKSLEWKYDDIKDFDAKLLLSVKQAIEATIANVSNDLKTHLD